MPRDRSVPPVSGVVVDIVPFAMALKIATCALELSDESLGLQIAIPTCLLL